MSTGKPPTEYFRVQNAAAFKIGGYNETIKQDEYRREFGVEIKSLN